MSHHGKLADATPIDKWDVEAPLSGQDANTASQIGSESEGQGQMSNGSLTYLMKPFAHINETKDELQKLGTVTIIRKQMVFNDPDFERRFIDSLEPKLRSRMILFGIASSLYAMYSMFFFGFFVSSAPAGRSPLIYTWSHPANKLFNSGCIINLTISVGITLVSWRRNMFRHKLERVLQYSLIVLLVVQVLFMNVWRVSCINAGRNKPSDVLREAFKGISDPYPDSDVIMLLTGGVLYMAVVADMRFRRLVWICIVTFMVYAISVIYFKLPRFEFVQVPTNPPEAGADPSALQPDNNTGSPKYITRITESPDSMLNWLLALELGLMFLISLFGKTQLELLQRQNFLELELAQKRIDVLERTINAIDSKNQPHSHIDETQRRLKAAKRIIEKLRLVNSGEAIMAGSSGTHQELITVLDILNETEKTMTLMDFQKEILLGPIKTGVEYKEEDVMNWLGRLSANPEDAAPTFVPLPSFQTVSGDLDLGISAKSLMKRLGVEWTFDPCELERTLKANTASDMNAFCLTARALLSPFLNNVILGVNAETLSGFAKAMSDAYLDVPFHRGDHAGMVCHHANVLLSVTGLQKQLAGLDRLAVLVAALGHDVSHFGRSNSFLVDTKHELALRYNDQSVLENFHASRTFEIIRSSAQTNILATLSKRDEKRFRNRVIQLILATDSSQHLNHLGELRMRLLGSSPIFQDSELADSDRRIAMNCVIIAADLGFFGMPVDIHATWMERLAEEMAQQGDNERALNLPISPMSDRSSQDIPGMAIGMMKLLVIPLFDEMRNLVKRANPGEKPESGIDAVMSTIRTNQTHWETKRRGSWSRPHLGSFDMFIPVPKARTITHTSSGAQLYSSEADPGSPPSLVPLDSPTSGSAKSSEGPQLILNVEDQSGISGDSDDDGPPILPFNAVHKI